MIKRKFVSKILISTILLLIPATVTAEGGVWRHNKSAPTDRMAMAVVPLKGKIYVIGGIFRSEAADLEVSDLVEEYDTLRDFWRKRKSLPDSLHHIGAAEVNGKIYVIGGFQRLFPWWRPVNTVYEYDPAKDIWSEKEPMPTPRGALSLGVSDGKIYAIGGITVEGNTDANEVYDPVRNKWKVKSPMPAAREHFGVAVVKGKIYAIGGKSGDNMENLGSNEVYDPVKNKWEKKSPMPTPRSGIAVSALKGKIYVFGGTSPGKVFYTVEKYDPTTNSWSSTTPMPTARHDLGSAVIENMIYVMSGGKVPAISVSPVIEVFIPFD